MRSRSFGGRLMRCGVLVFAIALTTSVWAGESYEFCASLTNANNKPVGTFHVSYRYGFIDLGREHAKTAVQSYYESANRNWAVSVTSYDVLSCHATALFVMRVQDNWPWEAWNEGGYEIWDRLYKHGDPSGIPAGLMAFGDLTMGEGVLVVQGNMDLWSPVAKGAGALGSDIGHAAQQSGSWASQRLPHVTCKVRHWHVQCYRS